MTGKPNKATIVSKLLAWAKLEKQRLAVEAQLDSDLEPHSRRYENATRDIVARSEAALDGLRPQLAVLAAEIEADLRTGIDAETGAVAIQQVDAQVGKATAIATVNSKPGSRVIDPQKFFALFPIARRVAAFWGCITIGVAKADKLVGESTVNGIATKTTKHTVELKLNV